METDKEYRERLAEQLDTTMYPRVAEEQNKLRNYTVKAEVEFSVRGTSITMAYKLFEKWMVSAFEASFKGDIGTKPVIAPSYYRGVSVVEERK
jgi:hypothetical protein